MNQDDFWLVLLPLLFVLLVTLMSPKQQREPIKDVSHVIGISQSWPDQYQPVRHVSHSGATPRTVHF